MTLVFLLTVLLYSSQSSFSLKEPPSKRSYQWVWNETGAEDDDVTPNCLGGWWLNSLKSLWDGWRESKEKEALSPQLLPDSSLTQSFDASSLPPYDKQSLTSGWSKWPEFKREVNEYVADNSSNSLTPEYLADVVIHGPSVTNLINSVMQEKNSTLLKKLSVRPYSKKIVTRSIPSAALAFCERVKRELDVLVEGLKEVDRPEWLGTVISRFQEDAQALVRAANGTLEEEKEEASLALKTPLYKW